MHKPLSLALPVLALAMAAQAPAATLEGLSFADQVRLDERELRLNGLGVRAIFIFKAYVAALYLPQKSSQAPDILRQGGAKRLQLRMLMEIGAPDIKKALVDGMRKNAGEARWAALQERADSLGRTIDTLGAARPGDSITLDYLPGRGLVLTFNDAVRGEPIPGADFYQALLAIFIGEDPVDTRLKAGLLGQ